MAALPPLYFNRLGDICITNHLTAYEMLSSIPQLLVGVGYTPKTSKFALWHAFKRVPISEHLQIRKRVKTHSGSQNDISD